MWDLIVLVPDHCLSSFIPVVDVISAAADVNVS